MFEAVHSNLLTTPALKTRIVAFMQHASTEITPTERARLAGQQQILAAGTRLSIALTPNASFEDVLSATLAVNAGGFLAMPHIAVSAAILWEALAAKQAWALSRAMEMQVVTQFGWSAAALWQRELAARRIRLAVRADIAGPAPLAKLAHFARQRVVGASLRALIRGLSTAARAPDLAITPDQHYWRCWRRRRCARQSLRTSLRLAKRWRRRGGFSISLRALRD